MRSFPRFSAPAAGVFLSAGGCALDQPQGPVGEAPSADVVLNGLHLNGLHLNGLHLNGIGLDDPILDGIPLDGVSLNGSHLNDVTVAGGALAATSPCGRALRGSDLAGARIAAALEDGTPLTLRIDAATAGDVGFRYTVRYAAGGGAWEPLCGVEGGVAVAAIPLAGRWDERAGVPTGGAHVEDAGVFTFACRGYALAKCVEIGYAPWSTVTECRAPGDCHTLPLAPFHQACTRLLRADYCGDGTATTRDGTLVDLWDADGVQTDDAPSWRFEAEWGPAGAGCVARTRWATMGADDHEAVAAYIQQRCPSRWQPATCGGPSSTFPPATGFGVPVGARALLRSRIDTP